MIFDDNLKIILLISSLKPMLWVLIRIARRGDSNEHPQHRFFEAILMNTHNIGFYEV